MELGELDRALQSGFRTGWRAIWQHKTGFLVTALAVFTTIFLAMLAAQPMYEGATLLLPGQGSVEQNADIRRQTETSAALVRVAESEEVVGEAIGKIGIDKLVPGEDRHSESIFERIRGTLFPQLAAPPRTFTSLEKLLPLVKAKLSVRSELNSDVIRIAYRHPDPTIAADFANAMAQSLVDRQAQLFSRPRAADFFMKQQQRFEDDAKRTADELEKFSARTAIYAAYDQKQLLVKRLSDLGASLALDRATIAQKLGERRALVDQLHKLAPVTKSPYVTSLVDGLAGEPSTAGASRNRLPEEKTPPLLLVRVYQDTMVNLFKINSDIGGAESLQKQHELEMVQLTGELNTLLENEHEFMRLKQAVDRAALNVDLSSKRMIEEQISSDSRAARISAVTVMQKALVPLRPMSPNYVLVSLAGLLLALLAGLMTALLSGRAQAQGAIADAKRQVQSLTLLIRAPLSWLSRLVR